jgi:hypothetical protein
MEKTEAQMWKEQYELLLKAYTAQQNKLEQWEAGGILWTWEDVQTYGSDDLNVSLSEEEAKAMLKEVIENHNPDRGVTWMVIDRAIKKAKGLLPISLSDFTPAPATFRLVASDRTSEITYTSKTDILRYLRLHGFFSSNNQHIQKAELESLQSGYTWVSAHGQHSINF